MERKTKSQIRDLIMHGLMIAGDPASSRPANLHAAEEAAAALSRDGHHVSVAPNPHDDATLFVLVYGRGNPVPQRIAVRIVGRLAD